MRGRVIAMHRAPAIRVPEPYVVLPPLAVTPDGRRYVFPDSRSGVTEYPFFVVDRDGTVRQIGRLLHGGRSARVQPRRLIGVIPRPVHSGTLHAIDYHSGDVIFVERPIATSRRSHTWQLVRVAASGDTVFSRSYAYDPVPIDRATVEREKQKQIELSMQLPGGGQVAFPREEVEALWHAGYSVPPFQSAVDEIMLAANGEIWLRRGAFGEPRSEWIVLDAAGRQVGSLQLPSDRRVAWASDRLVALVERDHMDVEYVSVNRLVRPWRTGRGRLRLGDRDVTALRLRGRLSRSAAFRENRRSLSNLVRQTSACVAVNTLSADETLRHFSMFPAVPLRLTAGWLREPACT
jgi:hypothetical protein